MTTDRKYFVDWIRVIAIGLLLIYHAAIAFQPWGTMLAFVTNSRSWLSLWWPMTMLNVWRIPLLFFVSGMGVSFAMQNRTWKQLLQDRANRIWLPFVVGVFTIVPLQMLVWRSFNHMSLTYMPNPAHLWFLGNIFCYVLLFIPLFYYLKRNSEGAFARTVRRVFSHPAGLVLVIVAFVAEAMIIRPIPYELYAMTWHGFFLGMLAFFFGYCYVSAGDGFWNMVVRGRWFFLLVAGVLFGARVGYFGLSVPPYLLVIESQCWIWSVLAFGCRYLNRTSPALNYLSQAAYPVYIWHLLYQNLSSYFIFQTDLPVQVQFLLMVLTTALGCFLTFEVIRRVKVLRIMFGLKWEKKSEELKTSS